MSHDIHDDALRIVFAGAGVCGASGVYLKSTGKKVGDPTCRIVPSSSKSTSASSSSLWRLEGACSESAEDDPAAAEKMLNCLCCACNPSTVRKATRRELLGAFRIAERHRTFLDATLGYVVSGRDDVDGIYWKVPDAYWSDRPMFRRSYDDGSGKEELALFYSTGVSAWMITSAFDIFRAKGKGRRRKPNQKMVQMRAASRDGYERGPDDVKAWLLADNNVHSKSKTKLAATRLLSVVALHDLEEGDPRLTEVRLACLRRFI